MPAGRPTEIGKALFEIVDEFRKRERSMRVKNYLKEFDTNKANCPFCGINHLLEDCNG